MELNLKVILGIVLGISLVSILILDAFPTFTNHSVSNQSITFAENNTYYDLPNSPIYLSSPYTPVLRYANGTTDVANYTFSTYQVLIGSNIANGTTYYAEYTYYDQMWVGGTNYMWVLGAMLVMFSIAVVAVYLL